MAYQTPGAFNLFPSSIPTCESCSHVTHARCHLHGMRCSVIWKYQVSYYTKIDSTVGIKLPGRNKFAAIWADGQIALTARPTVSVISLCR